MIHRPSLATAHALAAAFVLLCAPRPAWAQTNDVIDGGAPVAPTPHGDAPAVPAGEAAPDAPNDALDDQPADTDTDAAVAVAPDADEGEPVVADTERIVEDVEPLVEEPELAVEDVEPVVEEAAPVDPKTAGYVGVESGDMFFGLNGEYRLRMNAMSDIPLRSLPDGTDVLGQNYWGEQWLRLRGIARLASGLYAYGQADLLRGVAFGDLAVGVAPAAWGRDEYGYPGLRLRFLYLEWLTSLGLLRVGQMGFSWGLGMVANDGDTKTVFGDYRYGDLVRRIIFAARPTPSVPLTIAVAGDWVAWDLLADFERREDLAFQGVLAGYYGDGPDRVGAYVAYRWQQNALDDTLSAIFVDVHARYGFDDEQGGRYFAAVEAAYAYGKTTYARTVEQPEQEVEQVLGVLQVGRHADDLEVVLEAGYTSGDSNSEDAVQMRATMDPDHRVGLIMFPEVIAAQTARAAYLAQDPSLAGRASRGSELLPTNGGVAGASYFFPYVIYRPLDWLEGRLGGVFGYATSDVVDPFAQRALSRSVNYRDGNSSARELGFEFDASILMKHPLTERVVLTYGLEGGIFVPGSAFDDAAGNAMGPIGLARLRLGIAIE